MENWQTIVDSNIDCLVASVRRIVGNDHDAEDVVQEVFVEAYRLSHTKTVENWPGLLRRMGQRRAIDQLRRKVRSAAATSNETLSNVPSNNDGPTESCTANDLQDQLRRSLSQLSDREAAVFALAYFDGLPRSEIATTLQTTENAVNIAVHKATKKLKALLNAPDQTKEN